MRTEMQFEDRAQAAHSLAEKLKSYAAEHPLVLGIPRGAIPMAEIIAKELQGELSAILVHKIPAPFNEEFAIASIGLSGHIERLPYVEELGISEQYLQTAAKKQLDILKSRQKYYGLSDPDYRDRTVIIVDDGIATGATTLSAVYEAKVYQPKKVIVAAPVSSIEAAKKLRQIADDVVILFEPQNFYAVGQFFENFNQVSDEEVVSILNKKA